MMLNKPVAVILAAAEHNANKLQIICVDAHTDHSVDALEAPSLIG
jgi:hypothetical protein